MCGHHEGGRAELQNTGLKGSPGAKVQPQGAPPPHSPPLQWDEYFGWKGFVRFEVCFKGPFLSNLTVQCSKPR